MYNTIYLRMLFGVSMLSAHGIEKLTCERGLALFVRAEITLCQVVDSAPKFGESG